MVCQADRLPTSGKYSKIDAKMTVRAGFGLILPLLAVVACSPGAPAGAPAARQAIEAAVTRYVAATNRGDADALMELYAEDAVLLPPDHEPIEGREAIGAFWRQGTDQGLEVSTMRVETDGKIGYLVGRYRLPATAEDPPDSGKYVMCLKREADGSWKLTADIWNSSGEDDSDTEPGVRAPQTVSRLAAPRFGGSSRAEVPTGAGRDGPRWSERPA
jgi:uncharacterized protein (TIGR02246 family)